MSLLSYFFEDFAIGQHFKTRPRVLTSTELDLVPVLIGATNPLFLSDEVARRLGRPGRNASSLIPLCYCLGQTYQTGILDQTRKMIEMRGKILGRVYEQDMILTDVEITDKRDSAEDPSLGLVTFTMNVTKEDGTKVAKVDYVISVTKRSGS